MVVVDVEASGTEYHLHSIVSVGAIELEHPNRQFYDECRIWDGAHIMDEALAVSGFSKEEATDKAKKSEGEIVRAFIAWALDAGEHTLAGQNVSFDRDYLRAAAGRAGHTDWPFAYRTIDTHTLAYMHMIKRGLTPPVELKRSALDLDRVLSYCGLPPEPTPHNALGGALRHAEAISRLLYDQPLLDEFKKYPIPWLSQ